MGGYRIPVVEVSPLDGDTDIVFVPVEDIDNVLGEIQDEYDLGLGELTTELGAVKFKAKASVNVKAKTPAKKPAPKKPAPKPAAKKPAPKPPAKKVPAKPASRPVSKAPLVKVSVKTKVKAPAPKAAAKPKKSPFAAVKAAGSALTKISASLKKSIQAKAKPTVTVSASVMKKPALVKTTVKPGVFMRMTPPKAPIKPTAVVSKVASLATKISAMPAGARHSLAAAAVGKSKASVVARPISRPSAPIRKSEPVVVAAPPRLAALAAPVTGKITVPKAAQGKPIASLMKKLDATRAGSCACVVAQKKPAAAAMNSKPTLATRAAQIIDASKMAPSDFQSQVLTILTQIKNEAPTCSSDALRSKLARLVKASGVANVKA